MSPAVLDQVLGKLARQHDPNLLVGFDTADDAAVYRLNDDLALVQTVDFFTPIVDDPFTFGQIAAVNSLSDVYAMGGEPTLALAIVCFPDGEDPEILGSMLAGGLSKMQEANCIVAGGHSVRDPEIKLGYSVTGRVHPNKFWTNVGVQPGDALILTKPIGTGVISTAIKKGKAQQEWIDGAIASMTRLNRRAAEVVMEGEFPVHAVTDVTGFGLIGHLREMALGSKATIRVQARSIELLHGALECVRAGFVPGGLNANRAFAECCVDYARDLEEDFKTLLYDPQTAGGLLLSVPSEIVNGLIAAMEVAGVPATRIGEVVPKEEKLIHVEL
ncbi:MAG TPA: selenide, water dikinase SelD [Terriglobales bacterium]|nr:selenide, water dikinase SelD [Terriglobales bacterium]